MRPGESLSDHHPADPNYTRRPLRFDPYQSDPARWGFSLAHLSELILPCLEAVGTETVAEVGAYNGDLTRVLADWAVRADARVLAIDPEPQPGLVELDHEADQLQLIRQTSLTALAQIPIPDAVIIDGDHNYYTVRHELDAIGERTRGAELPLLLFHDVCWPHARRDDYFDADQIPAEYRHPVAADDGGGLYPGDPGLRPGGLPYPRSAAREGGPRNGVLSAVEDFVMERGDLRLVIVPAFFGFGVVWHPQSRGAEELARILDPFDRNPILERLEANRVRQLAESHVRQVELWSAQQKLARQERALRRLLESSAFGVAERLSQLRVRAGIAPAQSVISKEEIRRALGDG